MSIHVLEKFPVHAVFSTRQDGIMGSSKNPGPGGEYVKNRNRFASRFGINAPTQLVMMGQVHGKTVRRIPPFPKPERMFGTDGTAVAVLRVPDTDGLVALMDTPKIALAAFASDCHLAYLYYPAAERGLPAIIGIVHCGRAGQRLNIARESIQRIWRAGATSVSEIQVAIGPGICRRCHILYPERHASDIMFFRREYEDFVEEIDEPRGAVALDSIGILRHQFLAEGLKEQNIEVVGMCTACPENRALFISHRRDHTPDGANMNQMGFIVPA